MRKLVLGIFILIMLTVIYVSTDSVYATHPIKQIISDDPMDLLKLTVKPMNSTTMLVMGHAPKGAMEPIELMIMANGTVISRDQLALSSNFKYWTEIKINHELWNENGTYGNGTYLITTYQDTGRLPYFASTSIEVVNGLLEIPEFRISTPLILLVSVAVMMAVMVAVIVAVIVVLYQKVKLSKLNLKQ